MSVSQIIFKFQKVCNLSIWCRFCNTYWFLIKLKCSVQSHNNFWLKKKIFFSTFFFFSATKHEAIFKKKIQKNFEKKINFFPQISRLNFTLRKWNHFGKVQHKLTGIFWALFWKKSFCFISVYYSCRPSKSNFLKFWSKNLPKNWSQKGP